MQSALFSLGVALFPLYVFPSGGVQPAHLLLAIFSLLLFFERGVPITKWSVLLLATSLYVLGVESFYALKGGALQYIINAIYLSYNLVLASAVFVYCRRFGVRPLAVGIFLSTFLILGFYLANRVFGANSVRFAASFNNPNQLGFYSIILVSFAYLFHRVGVTGYFLTASLVTMAAMFSFLSLSKAAIIPVIIFAFIVLKPENSGRGERLVWVAGTLTVVFVFVFFYWQGLLDDYRVVSRIEGMLDESDTSLEARGYLAFLDANGVQLMFGMGSENVREIVGHEVHSTLASVFQYYGLFGLLLFGGALLVWARKLWARFDMTALFCIAGPAMLYGLTHNGTRFSIFWILFGASLAMAHLKSRRSIDGEG
jgi:hypothetical protein